MSTSVKCYYRAIWLSDFHLGEKHCQANYLLKFLQQTDSTYLFLVGDIVDLLALRKRPYWPASHQAVLDEILRKAEHGTRVIYIPGNHDDLMRHYVDGLFDKIEIHRQFIYQSPAHGRLLLLHGDEFDHSVRMSPLEAKLGDMGYDLVLFLNHWWNRLRRRCGLPYQPVADRLKQCSKKARKAMVRFRDTAVEHAQDMEVDGIVCGHIHQARLCRDQGVLYINTGDWVENCTAVLEHTDGHLELQHYSDQQRHLGNLTPEFEPVLNHRQTGLKST